ncbi:LysR family transcriptional regulator [Pararoseomonas sp. SCSIO 73927]|uniref:LysR family transcriptional regulator n=1 Tax=Pararoseomonas sp. SCSIO 73927 TaxID=3114537 RepID=UPI0030CC4A02
MMLDLVQVQGFVAVAEELHFGRAARRLNLTPSPLSRQVQALEHALGTPLLDRSSRSVRLTPAGQAFLGEARRLLDGARNAERVARQVARGEAGPVRLGYTAASALGVLPRLVAAIRSEMPGIDLVLEEMVTAEQVEALAARRLDLGLLRPLAPDLAPEVEGVRIAFACLARERLLLALPDDHPLCRRGHVSLRELDGQPFITWSPRGGTYFLGLLANIFRSAGVAPRAVQRVNQTHTMLALVREGIGLALVPESARALRTEGVVLLPLRPETDQRAELLLGWREGDNHPALARLRDLALTQQVLSDQQT